MGAAVIGEESAYFLSVNRNKRSLTLNLRDEKAQQVFLKLAADADVIVENFTPDVMPNFNLAYEDVKKVNPGVIYCSISGFGATGPYRNRPAYDQIMQGISGLMSITGDLGGDPQKVGIAVADIGAGMWAAFAVMTALFHRDSASGGGKGQYIDLSMLDSQVAWMTYQAGYYFATGEAPKRLGAAHPTLVPYQAFMGKDGKYFNVAVGSDALWDRFCEGIDRMDLHEHPDYASNGVRVNNRSKLVPLLQEYFLKKDADDWVADLQAARVPAGPINDLADVFGDEQVLHREMLLEMPHPTLGSIKQTGLPIKFSETRAGWTSRAAAGGAQSPDPHRAGLFGRRRGPDGRVGRYLRRPSLTGRGPDGSGIAGYRGAGGGFPPRAGHRGRGFFGQRRGAAIFDGPGQLQHAARGD